jgi:hypothetical protein
MIMMSLAAQIVEQLSRDNELRQRIRENLKGIDYGF